MGPKLATTLLLFFLPLLSLSLTNADAEEDLKKDLTSNNQIGAGPTDNQAGHQLVKREAGQGRKASCEGTRCGKKNTPKKGKKGQKPKKNEKKRKSLRRKRLQTRKKKEDRSKKTPKSGKTAKKRKSGKKKTSPKKSPKEKRKSGSRRRGEGSHRSSTDGRQITGNATSCAVKLVLYARLNEKKASSISKQVKRIIGNDKIQGSKGTKSGDFNATMDRLLSALGGDPNNPKCDGTPISNDSGRGLHRNGSVAKETLETLRSCSADIAEKCGSPLTGNATKKAELEACAALADNFKSAFASCTSASKSIDEACICIEAINATEVEEMQKCDASSDNSDALARKKACKKAVGNCKTAEANAVEGIDTCKERTKCGGAKDKEEAQRQLAALTPLNDALNRKEMDNAMASAGVASGPGADGTIPSSRIFAGGSRVSRDGTGCVELAQLWAQFNTSANQAAGSANGDLDTTAANETTAILNSINSRTTLVADLQSCSNGSSSGGRQMETVTAIIQIRIYIFWMGWWRETVITVKITIITSTFSIDTTSATTTTSAATTASATSSAGGPTSSSIAPSTSANSASSAAGTTTGSAAGSCRCGVKGSQRIVGGEVADVGEWPWIVVHSSGTRDSPVTDGTQQGGCGGTLVADNWVMTAAHCFYDNSGNQVTFADTMSVVIGEHTLATDSGVLSDNDENDSKRMNLEIETMIIHESYNPTLQTHDIALLKLKEKLDLNIYTPACLPDAGKDWAGSTGWVYGWGDTKSEDESSNTLRETSQVILTKAACEAGEGMADTNGDGVETQVSMAGTISDDMLCAEAAGKDSCQGDSGGPFTVDVEGQHHLVGVVSWGFGCAKAGLPGVYSSVSAQRDWVDQKINENGGAIFCQGSTGGSTGESTTASGGSSAASSTTGGSTSGSTRTTSGSTSATSGSTPISLPSTTASGSCKCGIKKTTRIVGGTETEVNEYPWIAAFDFSGTSGTSPGGCAATLVANNWAVTASHCFYNQQGELTVTKDTMSLVLGVHDRTGTTDTNRQVLTIEEIVLHPSYNPSGSSNDIALLKLTQSVDLNAWSPACLPASGADFTGQNGWVYGWGATSEGGSLADKLLELEVPIVSDAVCATAMSSGGVSITPDMLCAGGENGKDACGGDSGGPFTVANSTSGVHTLVGAVSFGIGCAREGLYGVYADVPFFRTWIDETIAAKGGATFCS